MLVSKTKDVGSNPTTRAKCVISEMAIILDSKPKVEGSSPSWHARFSIDIRFKRFVYIEVE